jgi:hypothetical protein
MKGESPEVVNAEKYPWIKVSDVKITAALNRNSF